MKRTLLVGFLLFLGWHSALAQQASKSRAWCQEIANSNAAHIIFVSHLKNHSDGALQKRLSDPLMQSVWDYMVQSIESAPYLSEREIAAAGYAYCVERRPANFQF